MREHFTLSHPSDDGQSRTLYCVGYSAILSGSGAGCPTCSAALASRDITARTRAIKACAVLSLNPS